MKTLTQHIEAIVCPRILISQFDYMFNHFVGQPFVSVQSADCQLFYFSFIWLVPILTTVLVFLTETHFEMYKDGRLVGNELINAHVNLVHRR